MRATELLGLLIQRIPYPEQVTSIDVTGEPDALTFHWCGQGFRIQEGKYGIGCEQITNRGVFLLTSTAILMAEILNPVGEQRTPHSTQVLARIDAEDRESGRETTVTPDTPGAK